MTTATSCWVEEATGKTPTEVTPLVGGMSSRVERCRLADGSSIVVRTITDTEWLRREPHLITTEARALELVTNSAVQAPRLIAADPESARLAMSFVDGSMMTGAGHLRGRADAIARLAAEIAATPLPADHGLASWRSWAPVELEPPAWGDAALWQRGIDAYLSTPEPTIERPCLLHRDLHPLNMLWSSPVEVAVVDWVNACVGHPHAELGHLRWNLTVLAGLDLAEHVLRSYLDVTTGAGPDTYDRWWDIAPLMSFVGGSLNLSGYHSVGRTDLTSELVVERTEEFLVAALA
jgi:aminoglycoside phosphotransferase (APT) family kinase protein